MADLLLSLFAFLAIGTNNPNFNYTSSEKLLAQREISLEDRQQDRWVNNVFKDNILLTLEYMRGKISNSRDIGWEEMKKPFSFEFKLEPEQTFAFHEDVLPEYQGKVVKTSNAHFNWSEGFKSDGWLTGDGVCHLASLMFWVAQDAKLDAKAPANHNFAEIPEIPAKYGVSIYNYPGQKASNAQQNLYIKNTLKNPVTFKFDYNGEKLKMSVIKTKENL